MFRKKSTFNLFIQYKSVRVYNRLKSLLCRNFLQWTSEMKKKSGKAERKHGVGTQSRHRPLYNSSAHPQKHPTGTSQFLGSYGPRLARNRASVVFHSGRRPPHATSIYSTPPLAFSVRKLLWIFSRRDEWSASRLREETSEGSAERRVRARARS